MKYEEYIFAASEITQLEELLDDLSDDMVIERMGLESRMERAKDRIRGIIPPLPPKRAHLTFRGQPILGNTGIGADFGTKAMGMFSDVITLTAAGFTKELGSTGPVPNREQNRPIITGVAIGSFGFEIEIPSAEIDSSSLFVVEHLAERALTTVLQLLTMTADGSDDDLSELANEIHPRAIKKVSELLKFMQRNDAWFALEFAGNEFRFSDSAEVATSAERLGSDNVVELRKNILGTLCGLMTRKGLFEMIRADDGTLIEGKLGPEMKKATAWLREQYDKEIKASITGLQVGQGKPRYTLRSVKGMPLFKR